MCTSCNLLPLLPFGVLCLGALLIVLQAKKKDAPGSGGIEALSTLALSLIAVFFTRNYFSVGMNAFSGALSLDGLSWMVALLVVFSALLVVAGTLRSRTLEEIQSPREFFALLLLCAGGAMLLAMSREFVTFFVALEVMSLSAYALCGSLVTDRRSAEASLKYFFLGALNTALFLYGVALLYGVTGSLYFADIGAKLPFVPHGIVQLSAALLVISLAGKLGAVPFHFWTPDVYEGAPTPVTAFMASIVKCAVAAAGIRLLWGIFGEYPYLWNQLLWVVAALSLIVPNLIALRQRSVKRILAYSSISHAGYIACAFLIPQAEYGGGSALLYYLLTYSLATIGAFMAIEICRVPSAEGTEYDLSHFRGIGNRHPFLALALTFFLLSLAGLPPAISGLLGKLFIFSALLKSGYVGLFAVAGGATVISCAYYLRIVWMMYFEKSTTESAHEVLLPSPLRLALAVSILGLTIVGVFPDSVYERGAVVLSSILPQ